MAPTETVRSNAYDVERNGASGVHTIPSYMQPFAHLAAHGPYSAAPLTSQAEQDTEEDNISFLRGQISGAENDDEDPESHRRTRRNMDTSVEGRRYTPAQLRELGELEERASRIIQREYNGWAPGTSDDEDGDDGDSSFGTSANLLDEQVLRRDEHLRDRMRMRRWRDHLAAHNLGGSSRPQENRNASSNEHSDSLENLAAATNESSLRATAMLQAVRRNNQFSAHSRNQLQRYILERERMGNEGDDRERANSSPSNASAINNLSPSQRRQVQREATVRHEIQQHRIMLAEHQQHRSHLEEQLRQQQQRHGLTPSTENRRRRLWHTRPPSPPFDKQSLDKAINYLECLRLCDSNEEGLETAEDQGFNPNDYCPGDQQDFLLNTTHVPPPPKSSWLQVGCVLSGTQHATSGSSLSPYNSFRSPGEYRSSARRPTLGPTTAGTSSPARSSTQSPALDRQSERSRAHGDDRWPVKVTIHSVDYDNMMLSGTMEAFNVPDKSSPTQTSSITTFLEGEIIDFNTFTLETKSFQADTRVDGTYWRKLPPFKDLKDDSTIIKNLLSRDWLRRELMEKWILMRWKGKP